MYLLNLANQMIESNVTFFFFKIPNLLKNYISLSNIVTTHILVIEGQDKSDEIKLFLESEGFDHLETKVENNFYTLVYQASGFKIGENLNDLVNKMEENNGYNHVRKNMSEMSVEIQRLRDELDQERREFQILKDKCENNLIISADEIKSKYVDRVLLSDKIREYISRDSRIPIILSMLGLSANIAQGDIIGNLLNI